MKNFKNLKVWIKGMEIVKSTYALAPHLPVEERFGLKIQMCRSAISIPSNIAEGSAKTSSRDYKRYLEVALGSSYELETQLLAVQMLNMCDESAIRQVLTIVDEEQKMLQAFIKKVED
jgi:four helix bundle protein